MFHYDELELLEFFCVEPTISREFGLNFSYEVTDELHRLVFGFNADTSDCSIQVFIKGALNPLLSFVYLDSPGVRVVTTKSGSFLEVGAPNSAPGSHEWFVPTEGLRIHLRPTLLVEGFSRV